MVVFVIVVVVMEVGEDSRGCLCLFRRCSGGDCGREEW